MNYNNIIVYFPITNPPNYNLPIIWFNFPDVVFGFESAELTVGEAVGSVDVCVVVFNPGASDALEAKINFNIQVQLGTAGESVFAIGC